MKINKKLNIDIFLFLYLSLLSIALLDHTVKCINFLLFNNALSDTISFIFALLVLITILILFFKCKIICLYKPNFNYLDIFCLGVFLFFYIIKLPFPDTSVDAMAHEIFSGTFALSDKFLNMKPYLPFNIGWFSLVQRVFYYLRLVLGYRLSTIINFFILCISYYKLKEIFLYFKDKINDKKFEALNKYFAAIIICGIAFLSLYKEYVILGETIVKTDLFAIPLFLECILFVLKDEKKTFKEYAYAGLLSGLIVAVKLNFITLILPIIIYFLIKEYKFLKFKNIFIAIIFFLLPVLPYIIFNIAVMGNPVFPFYNKFFNSPYFPKNNFHDRRWLPQSFLEIIFWPFVLIFKKERASELLFNSHSLVISYFVTLLVIILQRWIPTLKKILPMCICLLCSIILWAAVTGHLRYAMSLEIFSFFILILFILIICCSNIGKWKYLIVVPFGLAAFISLYITNRNLTASHFEWSWRPSIFTDENYFSKAETNLKYIFNDRRVSDDPNVKNKLDSVKTWVCIPHNGFQTLAKPDADYFMLFANYPKNRKDFTNKYFESRSKEGLYTFSLPEASRNNDYIELLNSFGFVVTDYERMRLNFVDASNPPLLLTLMLEDQAKEKNIIGLSNEDIKNDVLDVIDWEGAVRYTGFYDDNWIDGNALIAVRDSQSGHFSLSGYYPENMPENSITVTIENNESVTEKLIPGESFIIELDFENKNRNVIHISIKTEKSFIPKDEGWNEDIRKLGVLITSWLLSSDDPKIDDDIFN